MGRVVAGITISVDGYFTGPGDGPGRGLGTGGERLHYWVFGGTWTYDDPPGDDPTPEDNGWMEANLDRLGAVVAGRSTLESADRWGGRNPFGVPLFIVTHRTEEQPPETTGFRFVNGLETAVARAREAAGDRDVHIMGGGDLIRQALSAGIVDELSIVTAPVVLGKGKRLFEGFEDYLVLEHLGVRQSQFATFVDYRVVRD
ncbi:MAG: dihydrofolate reductase family protein [Actinomycetota bacterium]